MNRHFRHDEGPGVLSPNLVIPDVSASWWMGQAVIRLRREAAWQRHLGAGDAGQAAFDLLRHAQARREFLETDVAAGWLGGQLSDDAPDEGRVARLAERFGLTRAECFVLGLALLARLDRASARVFAASRNDAGRPWACLDLAQALWDEGHEVLAAGDPSRPLLRLGLIEPGEVLSVAADVALFLAGLSDGGLEALGPVKARGGSALARRLSSVPERLEVMALTGAAGADAAGFLAAQYGGSGRACVQGEVRPLSLLAAGVSGADLLLTGVVSSREEMAGVARVLAGLRDLAVRVFVHVDGRESLTALPADLRGPVIAIPPLSARQREGLFREALGSLPGLRAVARDFRLEPGEIARIGRTGPGSRDELVSVCRVECGLDFHGLAEPVEVVHRREDLILPASVSSHFDEAVAAVRGASRFRNDWAGDRLGSGGVALLFAGVAGTGKTMGAGVIAAETGLPLFRVDVSQVVNKYIGETEKNLKRIFDVAEKMRCILFFDEAEALFGKRMEAREANDRFANIETCYLLQRMETFGGVSVLATNRRKDLDEAFSRRLRYIIEFPVPGEAERRLIWEGVFPARVCTDDVDFGFLARRFQISGGHIRSIALNAGLQAAARGARPRVTMRDVLIATKRELDKLSRKSGAEAFGPYFSDIPELRP